VVTSIPGIAAGQLLLYAIYDIADEADLERIERVVRSRTSEGERISRLQLERQRTSVTFANPPVTVRLGDHSLRLGGEEQPVASYARAYDFGALTIVWAITIPAHTSLHHLTELAEELGQLQTSLDEWMRDDAAVAIDMMADGLTRPDLRDVNETLTLYSISEFDGEVTAQQLLAAPETLALVVGDRDASSPQLVADLHAASFSYTDRDLVVIGYDHGVIYDKSNAADIAALLEFALAQVLELDYYDDLLDERIGHAVDSIQAARRGHRRGRGRSSFEGLRSELMVQHMDFVEVLERVTAAVKVTEDFYYATVYRGAMRIFRAEEIVEATNRKLDLIYRTYTMLADEVDTAISHRLELIIVLLIVFEIILWIITEVIR
jgi:hypothetical protein